MTHAIDLETVSVHREGKRILSEITLQVSDRRIGIVGRNGSGKTTLARVIAGLVKPDTGHVSVQGVDVLSDRKAALRTVGILFQNPDHQIIFPTVSEEIGFGLKQMGLSAAEADLEVGRTLDRFDKGHWAQAPIHQMSQGQRQLVCLMSILAMSPKVILLDEPFAGLDIPTARQLERMIDGLDTCVVQITHAPSSLQSYDRVVWIEDGRMVMNGPPDAVLGAFSRRMSLLGDGDDLSDLAS